MVGWEGWEGRMGEEGEMGDRGEEKRMATQWQKVHTNISSSSNPSSPGLLG